MDNVKVYFDQKQVEISALNNAELLSRDGAAYAPSLEIAGFCTDDMPFGAEAIADLEKLAKQTRIITPAKNVDIWDFFPQKLDEFSYAMANERRFKLWRVAAELEGGIRLYYYDKRRLEMGDGVNAHNGIDSTVVLDETVNVHICFSLENGRMLYLKKATTPYRRELTLEAVYGEDEQFSVGWVIPIPTCCGVCS